MKKFNFQKCFTAFVGLLGLFHGSIAPLMVKAEVNLKQNLNITKTVTQKINK